jgi:hypothetical protein
MAFGCVATTDPYYYDSVYYDPYYYMYDYSYAYGWYDPYGYYYFSPKEKAAARADLAAAATAIAARAPNYYDPASCVTATASGTTVRFTYAGCTARFANRSISGGLTLSLSQDQDTLIFGALSDNLTVGGEPMVVDFTARGTTNGTARTLTIDSRSRIPSIADSRSSQATLTWEANSDCIDLSSTSTSSRGDITTTSTISNLHQCRGQCPSAGTVTGEGEEGTFSATFDGTNQLTVQSSNQGDRTFDLPCN